MAKIVVWQGLQPNTNGESIAIAKDENSRIIISYSDARAKKEAANRKMLSDISIWCSFIQNKYFFNI
jgi:hypothetical protein